MKRFTLIAATAVAAILAVTNSASARLGIAPLSAPDDAMIQVRGHGHGHGHWHGHRGHGHHYGWYRGRGNWRHHHRHW
ncbi:MAG: hypothetical protein ACJ8EO_07860 [Sphingomicrobium sp.]|jgi:hypothetical protein